MIPAALVALLIALPPPLCRGRNTSRYNPNLNKTPSSRAISEIRTAYEFLCPLVTKDGVCGTGEIFENPTIGNNAVTWVSGLGQGRHTRALIVYSPGFLNNLEKAFGSGASFGVLAHEVGHHLTAAGGLRKPYEHSWDEELRADWFAGCALALAGSPPDSMENALRALAESASSSHPSFAKRTMKVRLGFNECTKSRLKRDHSLPKKKAFGVSAVVRKKRGKKTCWSYVYRTSKDIKKDGPVAAKRRRSLSFANQKVCEVSRRDAENAQTEPCRCD